MKRIALACSALLLISGCKSRKEPILAKVGKFKITESEFRRKLGEVASEYQNYVLTPNGRRQFLDVLIREKMILAVASDSGVRNSSEFKAELERMRREEREKMAEYRDYLLTRMWLEDLRKKGVLALTDDEVHQYHDQHPTEVDVRHILVATPDEAEIVLRRARAGSNFSTLAKEKSLDAETASNGGKMPSAIYGEIIPELEDVVFKGKIGETIGPFKSKFGYHVLRKESERRIPFQRMEERIRRVMEKQKLDQHLKSMQSRYPMEVMDAQLN